MNKAFTPIPVCQYPRKLSTNCLAFSLGLVEEIPKSSLLYNLDHSYSIATAFAKKVKEFGFAEPRRIENLDDLRVGEYAFMVFDYTPYTVNYPFVGPVTLWNFHVVRRELDGTWVHKPGWKDEPTEIKSDKEWDDLKKEFGTKWVLFALAQGKDG